MKTRSTLPVLTGLLLLAVPVFAGIEWQTKTTTDARGATTTIIMQVYARSGIVRQEFIEAGGKNPLMDKGMYWLFKGDSSKIYIVKPDDKTYVAVNFDSMMHFAGAMSKMMQTTITNPTVTVKELAPEMVGSYLCKHILISSSYDMEMKIMGMNVRSRVESNREIWATGAVSMQDLARAYKIHEFKTGNSELDKLVILQMEKYKDVGFLLKSKTVTATTRNEKTDTSTTEMEVSNIVSHPLNADLFTIPADYTESDISGMMNPGM